MHVDDYPHEHPDTNVSKVVEKHFQERYLHPLGKDPIFVRLESGFRVKCRNCMLISLTEMHVKNNRCDDLIVKTAAALNHDIAALMLFAVQRDNVQLSVKAALDR